MENKEVAKVIDIAEFHNPKVQELIAHLFKGEKTELFIGRMASAGTSGLQFLTEEK